MVLLAATGGIVYTGAQPGAAAMPTWTAEFLVSQSGGPGGSGTAPDGQTSSATINFNQTNITEVTFNFQFADNYRFATISPAAVTFRVTSPLGDAMESSLSAGRATATSITIRQVAPVPDEEEFFAATEADAARLMAARHPANENGTGDWTVEVTVTRDYMTPIHPTGSIAWTATTRVATYQMELSEKMYG